MKLITNDPTQLTRRRVRRGVAWLQAHAPYDWERRMLDIWPDGTVSLRPRVCYDNEDFLSIAFEPRSDVARPSDGYVSYATVVRHFRLEKEWLFAHGFDSSPKWLIHDPESGRALERAWFEALTSYARPRHGTLRHEVSPREKSSEGRDAFREFVRRITPEFLAGRL